MIPLVIVNHLDVPVDVGLSDNGLTFKVGARFYSDVELDTTDLNRAVVFTDPFKFNRAHANRVLSNISYIQEGGLAKAVLAEEFTVQQMPISNSANIHQTTEQIIITMEEYRQYRCHKTLLTYCEQELDGRMEAIHYLSNYNITVMLETEKGTVVAVGCGMTLENRDGHWEMCESMITANAGDKLKAGFVFMPLHVFKAIDMQLGTYIVRGCE